MTRRFYLSVRRYMKEKRDRVRKVIRKILGRNLVKGRYVVTKSKLIKDYTGYKHE